MGFISPSSSLPLQIPQAGRNPQQEPNQAPQKISAPLKPKFDDFKEDWS
jgi:hypothetical protein